MCIRDSYKSKDCFPQAVADFSVAIEEGVQPDSAYMHRGYCNRKMEKFNESVADYSRALELLLPQNDAGPGQAQYTTLRVRAYTNRAYALARLNRYPEAIVDYTAILALEPLNSHAFHNRGISYDKMGKQDAAIADFSMVLEIDAKTGHVGNERDELRAHAQATSPSLSFASTRPPPSLPFPLPPPPPRFSHQPLQQKHAQPLPLAQQQQPVLSVAAFLSQVQHNGGGNTPAGGVML